MPAIVDAYNKTKHGTIGKSPHDVYMNGQVIESSVEKKRLTESADKLKVGDTVRLRLDLKGKTLEKGASLWSRKVYTIKSVRQARKENQLTQYVLSYNDKPVRGLFNKSYLQKIVEIQKNTAPKQVEAPVKEVKQRSHTMKLRSRA